MLSNRVKKNIWLVLLIVSIVGIIDRSIRVADGSLDWWNLVSVIIIAAFCARYYINCRKNCD